jgi:hypothetical protein
MPTPTSLIEVAEYEEYLERAGFKGTYLVSALIFLFRH